MEISKLTSYRTSLAAACALAGRPRALPQTGRGWEVKFPFSFPDPRWIPFARSPAFWLLPGTAARRPAAALWLGGWARRWDRPFQPALRAAPPRCSWALWAAGEAGASAWLSLPRPPGLRKFGTGCTKFPFGWRIPCRPAPPTPATFCRVLSPSSPLCFLSGPPPYTHTQHSALPLRVLCPPGMTLRGVQSRSLGSRAYASRPGIAWTSIHQHPARVRGDAPTSARHTFSLGKNTIYQFSLSCPMPEQAPGAGTRGAGGTAECLAGVSLSVLTSSWG